MKNLHKKQLRLSRRGFWLVCALLVCLRLALTSFQQAYTWVGGAPLDDELMFRAAQNITAGEWLGAYDYLRADHAARGAHAAQGKPELRADRPDRHRRAADP